MLLIRVEYFKRAKQPLFPLEKAYLWSGSEQFKQGSQSYIHTINVSQNDCSIYL